MTARYAVGVTRRSVPDSVDGPLRHAIVPYSTTGRAVCGRLTPNGLEDAPAWDSEHPRSCRDCAAALTTSSRRRVV
jgi:hypothetical protein